MFKLWSDSLAVLIMSFQVWKKGEKSLQLLLQLLRIKKLEGNFFTFKNWRKKNFWGSRGDFLNSKEFTVLWFILDFWVFPEWNPSCSTVTSVFQISLKFWRSVMASFFVWKVLLDVNSISCCPYSWKLIKKCDLWFTSVWTFQPTRHK